MSQTKLHHELSKRTRSWLGKYVTQRGFRWMQEFTLINGLRPDAVAFCDLQQGFYEEFTRSIVDWKKIESEFDGTRKRYIRELHQALKFGRPIDGVKKRWAANNKELLDKYELPENRFMFIFETKVTKTDFDSTFKRNNHTISKCDPFANFHFLVVPKDFMRAYNTEDLPSFYGILEQSGRGLRLIKYPEYRSMDEMEFYKNAYNMMFRSERVRITDSEGAVEII